MFINCRFDIMVISSRGKRSMTNEELIAEAADIINNKEPEA